MPASLPPSHSEFRVIKVVESSRNVTESQRTEKEEKDITQGQSDVTPDRRRNLSRVISRGRERVTNGQTDGESAVFPSSFTVHVAGEIIRIFFSSVAVRDC